LKGFWELVMDDDEAKMREFERLFMRKIAGTDVDAVHLDQIGDDVELFEQLMREIILPHLMLGGEVGAIQDVKVIRLEDQNKPKDKDSDLSWLDKYL
jgi:hypothetical protein